MSGVAGIMWKGKHPPEEALAAFLDGVLDMHEREEILKHLADCDDCRCFVSDWVKLADSFHPTKLPVLQVDWLRVEDGSLFVADESRKLRLEIPAWALDVRSDGQPGVHALRCSIPEAGSITLAGELLPIDRFVLAATVGPKSITLEDLQMSVENSNLRASGKLFDSSSKTMNMNGSINFNKQKWDMLISLDECRLEKGLPFLNEESFFVDDAKLQGVIN